MKRYRVAPGTEVDLDRWDPSGKKKGREELRRRRRLGIVVVVLVLCVGGVHAGETEHAGEPQDAVVREVVRMLEADVAETIILRWLTHGDRRPGPLSADDVIALTAAGASRELTERLLAGASPAPRIAAPPRQPEIAESGPPAADPAGRGPIPIDFSIHYRAHQDPEAGDDDPWRLFVYVDGRPVLSADGKNWLSKSRRVLRATVRLSAGPHVVRLAQERHDPRRDGWFHEARFCPEPIEFDARPGRGVNIEISEGFALGLRRNRVDHWSLSDDGVTGDERALPAPPTQWPPLCEEVEINYDGKGRLPRHARKKLTRCVRWAELWRGVSGVSDRSSVRDALREVDFRPTSPSD